MNSFARVTHATGLWRTEMGKVEEQTWTTVAADVDGEPVPEEVGKRMTTRHVHLAFKAEAELWLAEQEAEGWEAEHGPIPCATAYFGETDAPGNCWAAEVRKEVK